MQCERRCAAHKQDISCVCTLGVAVEDAADALSAGLPNFDVCHRAIFCDEEQAFFALLQMEASLWAFLYKLTQ